LTQPGNEPRKAEEAAEARALRIVMFLLGGFILVWQTVIATDEKAVLEIVGACLMAPAIGVPIVQLVAAIRSGQQ
jgi:hypothetical protein